MSDTQATRRPRTKKTPTATPGDAVAPDVVAPAAVAPAAVAPAETVASLPHEDVAERAYHKFLARDGEHGRDEDDWTEAERELHGERSGGAKRRSKSRR